MNATLRPGDLTLVTGGSGFLGSAVVRALIERGVRVRALVRATSPRDNLRGLDCEVVVGDLTDRDSLKAALQGRALPVPCRGGLSPVGARSLGDHPRQRRGHAQPQARGAGGRRRTHRLYQQRRRAAASRAPRRRSTRRRRLPPDEAIGAYKRSKTMAERAVEEMILREGCPPSSSIPRPRSGRATSGRRPPAASCSTPRAAGSRPSSTRA